MPWDPHQNWPRRLYTYDGAGKRLKGFTVLSDFPWPWSQVQFRNCESIRRVVEVWAPPPKTPVLLLTRDANVKGAYPVNPEDDVVYCVFNIEQVEAAKADVGFTIVGRWVASKADAVRAFWDVRDKPELLRTLISTGYLQALVASADAETAKGLIPMAFELLGQLSKDLPAVKAYADRESQESLSFDAVRDVFALLWRRFAGDGLDAQVLHDLLNLDDSAKVKFFLDNLDLVKEIAETRVTASDVVGLAYRRDQLSVFERLLNDAAEFARLKAEWGRARDEDVWQHFFEHNSWVFGYGLRYVFMTGIETFDEKLEQVVRGYSVDGPGHRVDAFMRTRGAVSATCYVEIKKHTTSLLAQVATPYRGGAWSVSTELTGAIAQIQAVVQDQVRREPKREFARHDGSSIGEKAYSYVPKCFVLVGRLSEVAENEQKIRSFELFRRHLGNPEILTFDELFERARYIVELLENDRRPGAARTGPSDIPVVPLEPAEAS